MLGITKERLGNTRDLNISLQNNQKCLSCFRPDIIKQKRFKINDFWPYSYKNQNPYEKLPSWVHFGTYW